MKYIAAGNVMLDTVRFSDGVTSNREHIGGPATFAYSGIKLWTDSVLQCSNVGADYAGLFLPWIEKNKIDTSGIHVKCDYCNHSFLVYNPDGTYGGDPNASHHRSDWIQDFGYMKTSPEEIGRFTSSGEVKGLYIAQNVDTVFWKKMSDIKKRDGFTIMWEIEAPSSYKEYLPAVLNALETADLFSINIQEAETLFDCVGEETCIRYLQGLPAALTLFRVGKKGLYSITKDNVFFLPSAPVDQEIDPTGCGNTSTGAALCGYCETGDALMAGIMANVAAAQNIRQFGVIPDFKAVRQQASALTDQLYNEYRIQNNAGGLNT